MQKLSYYHGRIGASRVVRLLVDKHIKRVEEAVAQGRVVPKEDEDGGEEA